MKEISQKGIDLIKSFEGFANESYEDTGGVWTIGFGTIRYPDGTRVAEGNHCTLDEAESFLKHDVRLAVSTANNLHWDIELNQDQFDALVSFQYNTGHLPGSTLYKKASVNPNNETIYKYNPDKLVDSCEFLRWVRDNGKVIKGLINRRRREADLYAGMMT